MLNNMSPMTVRLTVSDVLRRRGISTADFASRAKIAYNTALALRRGTATRVDFKTLAKVCEVLDVKPGDLFTTQEVEDEETQ